MGLSILLWRGWQPSFEEGLTFETVTRAGVGGTEMQMLWHAAHLVALGHRVQVIGTGPTSVVERGVEFVGARSRDAQIAAIRSGEVRRPDIVFLEGAYHAAQFFRETFPDARIVHIGQNIDVGADRKAFAQQQWVDAYAFMGLGHLADYSSRYPALRGKFVLIRNALPWREFHGKVTPRAVEEKVAWVGSWNKKGLRIWCEAMAAIMRDRPQVTWSLFGPKYGTTEHPLPPHLTAGLVLPADRITVACLPLASMLEEITSARVVVVSLGNECGPGSVLDAHAMGRPVVSGNDMVYAFSNPYGTGLRVSTRREAQAAVEHLLDNPTAAGRLGQAGRDFVFREYHEDQQREDLRRVIDFLQLDPRTRELTRARGTSHQEQLLQDFRDKVARKLRKWQAG